MALIRNVRTNSYTSCRGGLKTFNRLRSIKKSAGRQRGTVGLIPAMILGVTAVSIFLFQMGLPDRHAVLTSSRVRDPALPVHLSDSGFGLAKGSFLVADRGLRDPNFSETVVLLIDYDQTGAMGLIINRPTDVRLSSIFPEIDELEQRTDRVYVGGPVARNRALFLIRSPNPPDETFHIFEDVYLGSSEQVLRRAVNNAEVNDRFRVYAGHAGWAPKQLDREVSRGDWHILQADATMVFDRAPSEIWPELIRYSPELWAGMARAK